MADLKISQLTGATTPLAGTEVLPIVQSGSTVKVSVGNLTKGRTVETGSLGINVSSPSDTLDMTQAAGTVAIRMASQGAGSITWRLASQYIGVANAGFVIRDETASANRISIDSAGDVTVNTGNLVIGTSGKGIDFSATPDASSTSELLNDYEEGTWTPTDTSGAGLTFTPAQCIYTKVGRLVTLSGVITFPATASVAAISIGGLPFTQSASNTATAAMGTNSGISTARVVVGSSTIFIRNNNNGDFLNVNLSGLFFFFSTTYTV